MSTHADRLCSALLERTTAQHRTVVESAQRHTKAADGVTGADVLGVMCRSASALIALESLVETGKRAAEELRAILSEAISESGATGVETETHTVETRKTGRTPVITDASLLPADLMTRPKPAPDRKEIRKALERGRLVPGATLGNAGPDVLVLKAKKG